MNMQVFLDVASCYVPGPRLNDEETLAVLRAYKDDSRILTPDVGYAEDIFTRLDEVTAGAG